MSTPTESTPVAMASGAPAETPLRKTMKSGRTPQPLALVIFGATGDLTRRKLLPAVYKLFCDDLLPEHFAVVGFARENMDEAAFRGRMRAALAEFATEPDDEEWARFAPRLSYVGSVFEDPAGFHALRERLEALDREQGTGGNRLYYLAVPPGVMEMVAEQLGRAGLVCDPRSECFSRIIVEKPFGRDLGSAKKLNDDLHRVFDERQIFRIDHYLGKETTQNI
ncbi:MAG: glucose-6-phosphate dehydrogenase, partial [Longimicrobiaceae bacterium]